MNIKASAKAASNGATMLGPLEDAVLEAGRIIMKHYVNGCAVVHKHDLSPVTEADHAAEAILLAAIAIAFPDVPVVAEEEVAAGRMPTTLGRRFLLVDPLDGTREFLQRNGDFTVNIGLIEDGAPVAGLVYAPARNQLFVGAGHFAEEVTTNADHQVEKRCAIRARVAGETRIAVCSRSHDTPETESFLHDNQISDHVSVGSSLKFCLIARGDADIYPRFSPTMEWDTAAGDAVLRASGGMTTCLDGHPLNYGQGSGEGVGGFANPHFVAYGAGDAPAFSRSRT
ncbi:3'(2'),5'-bisphosphate nucleotidase CysQ [Brucella sp. BE17]|uniref:3'(2'),5'-bisphosphate nucleotidase CysQ n=1 Tax=Brucella sp. BE17 TaxID=3142977 RepID=UPI0031BB0C61